MAMCRVTGGVHSSQLSKSVSKKQLKLFNHCSPIVQNQQFSQSVLKFPSNYLGGLTETWLPRPIYNHINALIWDL